MKKPGRFITFEGIDGCGKTTQLRLLGAHMRECGLEVVETVEPGGTEIGKQVRQVLLNPGNGEMTPRAEMLLYFASRAQNVEQVIRPGLGRGANVLCDRFTDSTLAYQGAGRGLDTEPILMLDKLACNGLRPDLTILIDLDVAKGRERLMERNAKVGPGETRIDEESAAFHARVRAGYHALALREPQRIRVVNGAERIGTVAKLVWEQVEPFVR